MIDIRIPKEIRSYKEKLFFGLNLRQFICTTLALVINVPVYWYTRKHVGDDLASWLVILNAVPILAIGFVTYQGMTFEKLIMAIMKYEFIYPKKRIYKSENLYKVLVRQENELEGGKINDKNFKERIRKVKFKRVKKQK